MDIKEINMLAFGRFHNARIPLSSGLNIIYGVNESGKTTMHRFIEGMFFGFYKPYSKNRVYTAEHAKFQPWKGQDYRGVVVYEHEGRTYRLERSFLKGRESVKLFDALTGADISDILEYDSSNKTPKANVHLPINNVLFKNTVSIGQLSNITDNDLVREIGDLFVDTSGTHSAGVSLQLALDALEARKAAIGEEDLLRTPLGKDTRRLEELEEESAEARSVHARNMSRYARVKKLEETLASMQEEKGSASEQRRRGRLGLLRSRWNSYINLETERQNLQAKVSASPGFDETVVSDYERATARLEACEAQLAENEEQAARLRESIHRISAEIDSLSESVKNIPIEEMAEDKAVLESVSAKLRSLNQERRAIEDTGLVRRHQRLNRMSSAFNAAGIVSSVLGAAGMFTWYLGVVRSALPEYAGMILLGLGACLFAGQVALSGAKKRAARDFERYDAAVNRTLNMILMCELDLEQYRSKYKCKDVESLTHLLGGSQNSAQRVAQADLEIQSMQASLDGVESSREKLCAERDQMASVQAECMRRAGVDSPEAFRYSIAVMRERAVNIVRLENVKSAITETLADSSPQKLQKAALEAEELGIEPAPDPLATIEELIERSNSELVGIVNEISGIKEKISASEAAVRPLNVIAEETAATRARLERMNTDRAAYKLAIDRIHELSREIQSTFASAFNDYVSAMIAVITKGKYTKVVVNESMEIRVEDRQLGQFVDVSSLSGGTIDQLYFCVRFAIMDLIIKDKNIPVFLDDCMLQYDDARLNNILDLLYEKSRERQILLFTCRNAEKLALDDKGYPYNHIRLGELSFAAPAGAP